MTAPPSDGNERAADIVMISTDDTGSALLKERLEENRHLVTMLPDASSLEEILAAGRPKLLIYESRTGGREGYDVISRIRGDENLRSMPVLILTASLRMDDLLAIIESDADNFIAPPYGSPDHLSLIENLLTAPAGSPPKGEVRKQFKVRQDDQTYVVAATNRRLLEYVLSSFEIVSGTSSELVSVESQLRSATESVKGLEEALAGKTRDIGILEGDLLKKDQELAAQALVSDHLNMTLSQRSDEIRSLKDESDNDKARLVGMENALNEEKVRNVSLERTLHDLTFELEQQKSALAAMKTRSESLDSQIEALRQEKLRSEGDLNQVISGLSETANQHYAELALVKGEKDAETRRRISAEEQSVSIQKEFEESRSARRSEAEALTMQVRGLEEKLALSAAAFETERELRRSFEEKTASFANLRDELEKRIALMENEKELTGVNQAAAVSHLKEELAARDIRIQSLEAGLVNVARESYPAGQDSIEQGPAGSESGTGPVQAMLSESRNNLPDDDLGIPDPGKPHHEVQQPLILPEDVAMVPREDQSLVIHEEPHLPAILPEEPSPGGSRASDNRIEQSVSPANPEERSVIPETTGSSLATRPDSKETALDSEVLFDSSQWLDLLRWARHSETLSDDQRAKIIRMGRLIQKDRKLTKSQQGQVREILSLARTLGYDARQ